ncbi:hypothetical protein [Flavobacterium beibuense]|uniref:hypothetical protein n=1 Tax=Flavobacterium beibuense TaxID=657326 RepID=UPI003A94879C
MKKTTTTISLSLITCLLFSCNTPGYIKNKYTITGATAHIIDSTQIDLKLAVTYYSDSTYSNLFPSSIEKGQEGSDDKILFLGFKKGKTNEILNELAKKLNSKKKGYTGEKPERGYILPNTNPNYDDLIMIIKRKNSIDTLKIETYKQAY